MLTDEFDPSDNEKYNKKTGPIGNLISDITEIGIFELFLTDDIILEMVYQTN